jgi:hypothetical protein
MNGIRTIASGCSPFQRTTFGRVTAATAAAVMTAPRSGGIFSPDASRTHSTGIHDVIGTAIAVCSSSLSAIHSSLVASARRLYGAAIQRFRRATSSGVHSPPSVGVSVSGPGPVGSAPGGVSGAGGASPTDHSAWLTSGAPA